MNEIRCPYCGNVFKIDDWQIRNNDRFKCPKCRKYNEGSDKADAAGVLIGVSKEELKRFIGGV